MANFVTGASGFIGSRLCQKLAEQNQHVVALCRQKPDDDRLSHARIRIALGDIDDSNQLTKNMAGCRFCFHLAAIAKPWAPDLNSFEKTNVCGTKNVIDAAIRSGLERVIFTSTAGVFGTSTASEILNETSPRLLEHKTEYERSKIRAERIGLEIAASGNLEFVIVNPTRVFGPGPMTQANSLTRIMLQMGQGKWRLLPGTGRSIGNYAFVDDVIAGHILAKDHGQAGSNYILGGENLSFKQLSELIQKFSKVQSKLISTPSFAILGYAYWQVARASIFKIPPKLTPAFANKYLSNSRVSSHKAKTELGYRPRQVEQGIAETFTWLRDLGE